MAEINRCCSMMRLSFSGFVVFAGLFGMIRTDFEKGPWAGIVFLKIPNNQVFIGTSSGWWFRTLLIFHFIYGMSSFPLTNIFEDG